MISSIIHTLAWKHFFSVAKNLWNIISEHEGEYSSFRGNALPLLLLMLFDDSMEVCQKAQRKLWEIVNCFCCSFDVEIFTKHPSECFAEFSRFLFTSPPTLFRNIRSELSEERKKILLPILFVLSLWVFLSNLYVVLCQLWILRAFPSTWKWIWNLRFVQRFVDEGVAHCCWRWWRQRRQHNGNFTLNSFPVRGLIENNFLLFVGGANLFFMQNSFSGW